MERGSRAARGLTGSRDLRVYPVPDLRAFLTGRWRIARRISDTRADMMGRLTGWAVFTPSAGGLVQDETGDLSLGAYRGPVTRRYHLIADGSSTGIVRHADGSLFHALDLVSGTAEILHACGDDCYHGRYRVLDANRFTVSWQVTGPRKQYRLSTLHRRAEA